MFEKLAKAFEDVLQAFVDCFTDIANEIIRVFKRLGDFRNHAQKECHSCHGSVITRRRGVICQECGASFKAGNSNTVGG